MKILLCNELKDPRFKTLTSTVYSLKNTVVGEVIDEISIKDIVDFGADIIITNSPNSKTFSEKTKSVVVSIDDEKFSFDDPECENFIEPFIELNQENKQQNEKYACDVSFMGDPSVFGPVCIKLINNENILFKFFNNNPMPYLGFCGYCAPENYSKLYNMSKSHLLLNDKDTYRLYDVIYHNGNPVLQNDKNSEEFYEDILYSLNNESKDLKITKKEIISNHTNYDRMASIFNTIGLKKFGKNLKKNKPLRK